MEVIGILDTFQDAKIEDKTLTIFQRIGCKGFSQNIDPPPLLKGGAGPSKT